jgi:hypothetical protein
MMPFSVVVQGLVAREDEDTVSNQPITTDFITCLKLEGKKSQTFYFPDIPFPSYIEITFT